MLDKLFATCRHTRKSAAVFGAACTLFSLCTVYEYGKQGVSAIGLIAAFLIIAAGSFAATGFARDFVEKRAHVVSLERPNLASLRVPFALIFTSFALNWLANWPMAATADSMASVNVALGNHPLTAWHTLAWVGAVFPFVKIGALLGDSNLGIAAYTLFQSAVFALIYAYVCAWIKRKGAPRALYVIAIAFFALNPVVAQFAVYLSKDGPFATFFVLYATLLLDVAFSRGGALRSRKFLIAFAIVTFLVAAFRMNGMYATALIIVILLIAFRKTLWKRIAPLLLIPALVWFAYGPACDALGIQRSPFSESASAPLSQIGYVLQNDGIVPEEAAETLDAVLPLDTWGEVYTRESVNPIKFHEDFDNAYLEKNKAAFFNAWLQVGMSNPGAFVDAWLQMTEGFWNIDSHPAWIAPSATYHYSDPSGYAPETELQPSEGLLGPVTGLALFDRDVAADIETLKDTALFYPLCNIACLVWFAAFSLCAIAVSRQKGLLWTLPLAALFAVYATVIIATPVWCEFRYVYVFHLTAPLILSLLFLKRPEPKGGERTTPIHAGEIPLV